MKKLRSSHYDALSRLAAQPEGRLRRLPGGFWTTDPLLSEYQQGEWSTTKPIVMAMHTAKLIEPVSEREFRLTPVGEEALKTGSYPC